MPKKAENKRKSWKYKNIKKKKKKAEISLKEEPSHP